MKLIRKTMITITKNGCEIQWAIFWCSVCSQEVEKSLSNGLKAKSCGCNQNPVKHGESYNRLYRIWINMKSRCLDENNKYYGGRGITVCSEWANDYTKFRDWALHNGHADNLEIDRKDTNGNYEPSNCHFVTTKENIKNRRGSKIKNMEIANEIRALYNTRNYTQQVLAEKFKVGQKTISQIINNKSWGCIGK